MSWLVSTVPTVPVARAVVLVADDEPLTRWALRRTLERAQFDVSLAATRDEVCDLLDTCGFHVAVMSHELGHHSMIDVLNGLSCDHRVRGLVILYDGESADDVRRGFPAAVVVQKPFGLEAVTAAVEGFLEAASEAC